MSVQEGRLQHAVKLNTCLLASAKVNAEHCPGHAERHDRSGKPRRPQTT